MWGLTQTLEMDVSVAVIFSKCSVSLLWAFFYLILGFFPRLQMFPVKRSRCSLHSEVATIKQQ